MLSKTPCELLLPVGNMKMCLAAIHNGADAIYVGVPEFNARGRSVDHNLDSLAEIIEICHLYGVKVNLAFNVVIFEDELIEVIKLLKSVIPLGPDAIIVQDLGLAQIIRDMAPNQIIHGSTQMTITNFEAMILLSDLSIKRFVLGREVSIAEMKLIRAQTDIELEVFVHGALCVAYSGQCFTSESIGGRSANRGQCAQSCRFEYEMIVDGTKFKLVDKKYLVSPHDLCGIAQIPELLDLNINSFKVEGRLKTPEYVASTGRQYRKAIDRYYQKIKTSKHDIDLAKTEMGLTFSRGFYSGWLNGIDHQALVTGTYSSHRGIKIGTVSKVLAKSVIITTTHNLKNGDGLLFASIQLENKVEIGGKIIEIKKAKDTELFFHKGFDFKNVKSGFEVYLNSDAIVANNLTKSFEDKNLKKKIPVNIIVKSESNSPLEIIVTDNLFNEVIVLSEEAVSNPLSRPTKKEDLENELGALGGSIYYLNNLVLDSKKDFYLPQKELKVLRRKFTEELNKLRIFRKSSIVNEVMFPQKNEIVTLNKYNLNILLRSHEQVINFLSFHHEVLDVLGIVYLDFEFGSEFIPSVKKLKEKNIKVGIATTRILKPTEYHNFKLIERANPDVILVRNLGALHYFQNKTFELRGDFSLNITNSFSLKYILSKNLKSVCASYDLNTARLIKLLSQANPGDLEVTIHQYMPAFHMEHCVFAAFMSKGHTFRDCGKPCESHSVEMKDQFGNFHFLKADQECRNTMYNAIPQSAARKISDFKKYGLREFRFEALSENSEQLKNKIKAYRLIILNDDLANNSEVLENIFKQIGTMEKYGMGEGTLTFDQEYKDRKKER